MLCERLEVREDSLERSHDLVSRRGHVDVVLVVVGADMVDVRLRRELEVNLGVLEDELVGVVRVQRGGEWRDGEVGALFVDPAEALVEEVADGLLANPVVAVGVESTVRGEAPETAVVEGADERATEVLGSDDRALDRAGVADLDLLGLGESEAEKGVSGLVENGTYRVVEGGAKLGRLGLADGEVPGWHDHVVLKPVQHTAVLGGEVDPDILEGLRRERGDVASEKRHFRFLKQAGLCLGIY